MNIGEKLRYLRRKAKRTLEEQAELLDVSLNSVYRWEHELTAPKKAMLHKIADIHGVPYNWLLREGGPEPEGSDGDNAAPAADSIAEQQLLTVFNRLSEIDKYKVLGYIERIYVEGMDRLLM
jgi:transcriptional regulator with XRE-family HTH domain